MKLFLRVFHTPFFSQEELNKFAQASANESAGETAKQLAISRGVQTIKPFCYFTSMIWQALQEDENPLSSKDAYWLGAVDEVYDSGLPCLRDVAEAQDPEQPNLPASDSTAPAKPVS